MKSVIIRSVIGTTLLILSFVGGCMAQHAKTGYHYEVHAEKEYASPLGLIHWKYVTESAGIPFLDPGKTVVEFEGRTIYAADRIFQEHVPFAQNITTSGNSIDWDDGEYQFSLRIQKMNKESKQVVQEIEGKRRAGNTNSVPMSQP